MLPFNGVSEAVRRRRVIGGEDGPVGVDVELHAPNNPCPHEELCKLQGRESGPLYVDEGAIVGDASTRSPLVLYSWDLRGARGCGAGVPPRPPVGTGRLGGRLTAGDERNKVLPDGDDVGRHGYIGSPRSDRHRPIGINHKGCRPCDQADDGPALRVVATLGGIHLEPAVEGGDEGGGLGGWTGAVNSYGPPPGLMEPEYSRAERRRVSIHAIPAACVSPGGTSAVS